MKLLRIYRLKLISRRASEINRKVRLLSFDKIRKVGILWHESDSRAYNYLYDEFKVNNVIVRNLCITNNKDINDGNMITPKDLNWLGFPKGGNIEIFTKTDFDVLLNTTVKTNFALDAITTLSAASFKIGWDRDKTGLFDLTIDVSKQPDALYLAEQQIKYLKQLNKNE